MQKLSAFFRLIRFELPFSAGICVLLGQVLSLGSFASFPLAFSGFMTIFCVSSSILVHNDIIDLESDRINSPERPLSSKLFSRLEAVFFVLLLIMCGLIFSYFINLQVFAYFLFLLIIGFAYNILFKKYGIWGNLLVSISVGSTFLIGGLSTERPLNEMVIFFSVIAALIDLAEEIAADSTDVKGDLLIDSKSVAIVWGEKNALKISLLIFMLVIGLTGIPFLYNWFSNLYLIPILIIDFSIAFSCLKLIGADLIGRKIHIRRIYIGATIGLLVFLIMRCFGV